MLQAYNKKVLQVLRYTAIQNSNMLRLVLY